MQNKEPGPVLVDDVSCKTAADSDPWHEAWYRITRPVKLQHSLIVNSAINEVVTLELIVIIQLPSLLAGLA